MSESAKGPQPEKSESLEGLIAPARSKVAWRSFAHYEPLGRVKARYADDVAAPFSLDEAAELACMTPTAFSRFFHVKTGVRFSEWKDLMRAIEAARLIAAGDRPIGHIAQLVGYGSVRSFQRGFKRVFGMSPARLRKLVPLTGMLEVAVVKFCRVLVKSGRVLVKSGRVSAKNCRLRIWMRCILGVELECIFTMRCPL